MKSRIIAEDEVTMPKKPTSTIRITQRLDVTYISSAIYADQVTTRMRTFTQNRMRKLWHRGKGLNLQPSAPEADATAIELPRCVLSLQAYLNRGDISNHRTEIKPREHQIDPILLRLLFHLRL